MKVPLLSLAIFVLFSGCTIWNPGGGTYTSSKERYSLTPPPGWHYRNLGGAGQLQISREHPFLQSITIDVKPLSEELPHSKRKITSGLSQLELLEILADEHRADKNLQELTFADQAPIDLNGTPGVRYTLKWHDEQGLTFKSARVVCVANNRLYTINLTCPARHYFDLDLPAFNLLVGTFRVTPL